jgi:hypothetical protein
MENALIMIIPQEDTLFQHLSQFFSSISDRTETKNLAHLNSRLHTILLSTS